MRPYYDADGVTIYHGDALDVLPTLSASSVRAVVTAANRVSQGVLDFGASA